MLIGGFAVIAHGGARTTKDIDLLVRVADEIVVDLMAKACGVRPSLFT